MSKVLVCHPDNLEALKARMKLEEPQKSEVSDFPQMFSHIGGIEVRTNSYMDKYREEETGNLILPNGSVVPLESFELSTRWITYGPEDLDYLLWSKAVKKEVKKVLAYYLMDTSFFNPFKISRFFSAPDFPFRIMKGSSP